MCFILLGTERINIQKRLLSLLEKSKYRVDKYYLLLIYNSYLFIIYEYVYPKSHYKIY